MAAPSADRQTGRQYDRAPSGMDTQTSTPGTRSGCAILRVHSRRYTTHGVEGICRDAGHVVGKVRGSSTSRALRWRCRMRPKNARAASNLSAWMDWHGAHGGCPGSKRSSNTKDQQQRPLPWADGTTRTTHNGRRISAGFPLLLLLLLLRVSAITAHARSARRALVN